MPWQICSRHTTGGFAGRTQPLVLQAARGGAAYKEVALRQDHLCWLQRQPTVHPESVIIPLYSSPGLTPSGKSKPLPMAQAGLSALWRLVAPLCTYDAAVQSHSNAYICP